MTIAIVVTNSTTAPTTYTPYIGQTNTLTMPKTVYGGEVDAVRGEGRQEWMKIALSDTYSWFASTNVYRTYYWLNLRTLGLRGLVNSENSRNWKCTHFESEAYSYNQSENVDNTISFQSDKETLSVVYPGTIGEFKAYLAAQYAAGTPVQVCYKLAEPAPFTATGAQQLPALAGLNTILTDADSATVTGRADPIKRITDLEDAVASQT